MLLRLAVTGIAIACGVAACGAGSSSYVAKVGSQPITTKQLDAVLRYDRSRYPRLHLEFPRPGSAEYLLLRAQAIDYLVEQSRAHQADAKLGVLPRDRVVSDAAFRKVTAKVHVTEADVEAYFQQHRTKSQLDLGTAQDIEQQLLQKRRAVLMHGFVAAVRRDYPVTYAPKYAPVSEVALARKVWIFHPSHTPCDLRPGFYQYPTAVEHGCAEDSGGPVATTDEPPCPIVEPPGRSGFTSAEENDGFAEYSEDNAGTCSSDPRGVYVSVTAAQLQANTPVKVSYLPRSGTGTFTDQFLAGVTLRYPRRLHVQQLAYGSVTTIEGIEIANFALDRTGPTSRPLSSRATEFLLTNLCGGWNGPGPQPVKLPIRITDASLRTGYSACFSADGETFGLTIRTGSSPSEQDVEALRTIAASIHFAPLRIGHVTPDGLYVLGRASDYPFGSVTEIPASSTLKSGRFYLEHAADGFWTITWPDDLLHGYKACGPHWDAQNHRFTCANGAVWDSRGKVVRNPDPARDQDDPLRREPVGVADGYVLVPLPPRPY